MIINKANILIPNNNIDLSKWSIIACDQFTSNIEYWKDLEKYVDDTPSTLNLIIPEAYLNTGKKFNCDENIKNYFNNSIFNIIENSYILVDRQTPYHKSRLGLICCIDLENYNFTNESKSLIRASEGTLYERILPRITQREKSIIEFPHIMLLFDDRNLDILKNLYNKKEEFQKIYDFDLNGNGGHLVGYQISKIDLNMEFEKLLDNAYLQKIFGVNEKLLFLVGDGNHSLATAKVCWDKIKQELTDEEKKNHPARFCLVEICNINDEGIEFHPIHRVLFNYDKDCIESLKNLYSGKDYKIYSLYCNGKYDEYKLPSNTTEAINLLQNFLEKYLKQNNNAQIDYIHDNNNVISACDSKNGLGIFTPTLKKSEIFKYVIEHGVLPKKSFSIGKSLEKRYYLEGKVIKNLN